MDWRGKTIVDLSRAFLDTNGAHQEADVTLEVPTGQATPLIRQMWLTSGKMAGHAFRSERVLTEGGWWSVLTAPSVQAPCSCLTAADIS